MKRFLDVTLNVVLIIVVLAIMISVIYYVWIKNRSDKE